MKRFILFLALAMTFLQVEGSGAEQVNCTSEPTVRAIAEQMLKLEMAGYSAAHTGYFSKQCSDDTLKENDLILHLFESQEEFEDDYYFRGGKYDLYFIDSEEDCHIESIQKYKPLPVLEDEDHFYAKFTCKTDQGLMSDEFSFDVDNTLISHEYCSNIRSYDAPTEKLGHDAQGGIRFLTKHYVRKHCLKRSRIMEVLEKYGPWSEETLAGTTNAADLNWAAWIYVTRPPERSARSAELALRYARRAVALERSLAYLDTLAAAYAENGNFQMAVQTQIEALALRKSNPPPGVEDSFVERLKLYKKGIKLVDSGREW